MHRLYQISSLVPDLVKTTAQGLLHTNPSPLPASDAVTPPPRTHSAWSLPLCLALGTFGIAHHASAQGTFSPWSVLQTDSTSSLHTDAVDFLIPQGSPAPASIAFQFGFDTDETFDAGAFFDSFSITLQDANNIVSIILLTADASGTIFLPPTIAGDPLDATSIQSTVITPPELSPTLASRIAFSIQAFIPDSLIGKDAKLYLDLFDNGDSVRSQAWFGQLTVVPEPSSLALLGLGMAGLSTLFWRSRKQ